MFDIAKTKQNMKAIQEAAEHHRDLTRSYFIWSKRFFIFPRKCYLSGESTGWFSKVMVGTETCKLKQLMRPSAHMHPNRIVYVREDMYFMALLKDDPRLEAENA